jgi:hypothetical protein
MTFIHKKEFHNFLAEGKKMSLLDFQVNAPLAHVLVHTN